MNRITFAIALAAIVSVCQPRSHSQELVFAELDGVQLVSIPQPPPGDGFLATKLQARAVHAEAVLAAFTNLSLRATHQVWTGNGLQAVRGTAKGPPEVDEMYAAEWVPFDSHLLITADKTIGSGAAYVGITDANDGSTSVSSTLPFVGDGSIPALTGFGDIAMQSPTDAFFLMSESQARTVDLAYLVTSADPDQAPTELTLGILGSDPEQELFAKFGYREEGRNIIQQPIVVPFLVPEPSLVSFMGVIFLVLTSGCRKRRSLEKERRV